MYRIAWRSKHTGATGHGNYLFSKVQVDGWVKYLQTHNPNLFHWPEAKP